MEDANSRDSSKNRFQPTCRGICSDNTPEEKYYGSSSLSTTINSNADTDPFSPANPDTTEQGCTCADLCYARIAHDLAKRDWCWTAAGCGKKSMSGRSWDYCSYPEKLEWETRFTYREKLDMFWTKVREGASNYDIQPRGKEYLLVMQSAVTQVRTNWDVRPNGQTRRIHEN